MHHPFPLLSYPAHGFVVGGGCGGWKCTISSAELWLSWQSLALSSGVLNRIKPVVPVARVRVFPGYYFGYPYPYPRATRDVYPRVSRTRGIP